MNIFRISLLLLLSATLAAQSVTPQARAIHNSAIVVDTHADTPQRFLYENFDIANSDPKDIGHVSLDRARAGNLGAEFFSIWADPETTSGHFAKSTFDMIDSVYEQAARHPDRMMMAFSVADIERAHKEKKLAALMGIEGGHSIENDIHLLHDYYRLGVRYMTLTHFKTNDWADSSADVAAHNGLSDFGREVVREMNHLGMMVDISHVSDKTFYDALEVSRAPLIASHSSLRALCDIPRNMSDDMIRALARKGGLVNINFNTAYLDRKAYDTFAHFRDQRDRDIADMMGLNSGNPRRWEMKRAIQQRYLAQMPKVGIDAALRTIDHAVKVAGADHVGFGSDFDGVSGMVPAGMEDVSKYPELVRGLIDMGYADEDIRKITGENLLRVMRAAEEVAGK